MQNNEWRLVPLYQKILYMAGPLLWGALVWFLAWGPGTNLLPNIAISYQLNFLLRISITFGVIYFIFGNAFNKASRRYIPTVAELTIPVPRWWQLVALVFVGTLVSCFFRPLWEYPILNSLVLGVLISACFEELVARGPIIKFHMSLNEFIVYNLFSSIAFALMHVSYLQQPTLSQALSTLTAGYIFSSFMWGIVAYKTRRIEVAIVLHMLHNLVCLIPMYPLLQAISIFVALVRIGFVAWGGYRQRA